MFRALRLVRQAQLKLNRVRRGKAKALKGAGIPLSTKTTHRKSKSGATNKTHQLCRYAADLGKTHQVVSKIRKVFSSKQVRRSVSKLRIVKNNRLRNLVAGRSSKLNCPELTLMWKLKEQPLTISQKT